MALTPRDINLINTSFSEIFSWREIFLSGPMAVNINIGDRKDADNGYISNSVYFLGSALRKKYFQLSTNQVTTRIKNLVYSDY